MGQIQQSINQLLGTAAFFGGVKNIQKGMEKISGEKKDLETELREKAE